jgi:hypothetical protein
MLIQYLVGLCCVRANPEAVEVMIGDMVHDEAAEKERDVDVTVTITSTDGAVSAFKAVEVKHEGTPLDVSKVEQLIMKMADMPKVTHKAIFSTSGYTDGAQKKAGAHGVELYTFETWDRPIEEEFPDFPGVGTPSEFLSQFASVLLHWVNHGVFFVAPSGPQSFNIPLEAPMLDAKGRPHSEFSTHANYVDHLLMRSTGILCTLNPAAAIARTFPCLLQAQDRSYMAGPEWPHTHTLDIRGDGAFVSVGGSAPFQLEGVTISGMLQWRRRVTAPHFMIAKRATDGEIFAGAAVADYGVDDGRMFAMVFPQRGRELGIHQFQISEKQRNIIKKLKIK